MDGVKVKIEPGLRSEQNAPMKSVHEAKRLEDEDAVIKKEPGVTNGNALVAVKVEADETAQSWTERRKFETPEDIEDKKATQVEVLALRTQVAYLQDTIEDLRKQLDCVLTVLDDSKSPDLESAKGKKKGGKKQQVSKASKIGMKRPRSFGALPFAKTAVEAEASGDSSKSGNSLNLSAKELSQVCEILEKGEVEEAPEESRQKAHDEKNEVIRSISEATQLDRDSVCKIIKYFSELTTKEHNEGKVSALEKIEVTLQAQKVGAN